MERRNTIFLDKYPDDFEAILDKQKRDKEEALKIYGNYLISITNICFEKCIDTSRIQMSKSENKCIEACHGKLHKLYYNTFTKFHTEETFNLNRATDFGDKYDFHSYLNRLKLKKNVDNKN